MVNSTIGTLSSEAKLTSYSFVPNIDGEDVKIGNINDLKAGVCGLINLGNTCFMNSTIQCMSNIPLLTKYFCENKYTIEVNRDNPLGTKGELVTAYAKLINELWNGESSLDTSPSDFKSIVGKYAPQFMGYEQQDSHELLRFLLDGLHEDLNRVLKKPYVLNELSDQNTPDEVLAKRALENYRKRNDSIIADLFSNLIKTTINCLVCNQKTVEFEPQFTLSLPLVSHEERLISIKLVANSITQPICKYNLKLMKHSTIKDLLEALERYTHIPSNRLVCCDVFASKFFHIFNTNEIVTSIRDIDQIFVYELPVDVKDDNYLIFHFYLKYKRHSRKWVMLTRGQYHNGDYYTNTYFGLPMFVAISREALSKSVILNCVHNTLRRFLNGNQTLEIPFAVFVSKAGNLDTQAKIIDEKTVGILNEETKEQFVLVVEFSRTVKEKYYNAKVYEDVSEHESCQMKVCNQSVAVDIEDCFSLLNKNEASNEPWYCSKCKKFVEITTKQTAIWLLAPVLVVHFKRLQYNSSIREKNDTFIKFPIDNFNLKNYLTSTDTTLSEKYNLVAISNHYGSLGGGHYTTFAQNSNDANWYQFDDASVRKIQVKDVCTNAAFYLIYLRQDFYKNYFNKT